MNIETPKTFSTFLLWLIGAILIILSIFEPNLMGFALFCLVTFSIFGVARSKAPLILIPIFISLNTEFMHTSFSIGTLGIPWKLILLCMVFFYIFDFYVANKKLPKLVISPKFYLIWLIYLVFGSVVTHSLSVPLYIFVGLLFLLSIACQLFISESTEQSGLFLRFFIFSIFFLALVGYLELLMEKTFFLSKWAQEERFRYGIMRIGSTVGDANFLCSFLIPTTFLIHTSAIKKNIGNSSALILTTLFTTLILLTFSRTGLAIFAFGLFSLLILKSKHYKILLLTLMPLCIMLGITFVLPKLLSVDVDSNSARLYVNSLALNVFIEHPLTGIGLGNFTKISGDFTESVVGALDTMNTYTMLLTSGGIINIIFYFSYIVIMLLNVRKLDKKDSHLFFVAFIAYNLFIYTLDSFYSFYTWIFPTLLLSLLKFSESLTLETS